MPFFLRRIALPTAFFAPAPYLGFDRLFFFVAITPPSCNSLSTFTVNAQSRETLCRVALNTTRSARAVTGMTSRVSGLFFELCVRRMGILVRRMRQTVSGTLCIQFIWQRSDKWRSRDGKPDLWRTLHI